jgi:hypothetical protein
MIDYRRGCAKFTPWPGVKNRAAGQGRTGAMVRLQAGPLAAPGERGGLEEPTALGSGAGRRPQPAPCRNKSLHLAMSTPILLCR